jgi:Ankyrin repeats (many copies)
VIARIKKEIREDVSVFGMFDFIGKKLGYSPLQRETILHHAVSGAAADADLVHWMALMGAMDFEENSIPWDRSFPAEILGQEYIVNPTGLKSLHRAIIAGKFAVVRVMLEFDNCKDINLKTATEDGDSPLHLALRHGHSDIALYLDERNADNLGKRCAMML